jgi:hypothetical protein
MEKSLARRRHDEVRNSSQAESLTEAAHKREGLEFPVMIIYKFVRAFVTIPLRIEAHDQGK